MRKWGDPETHARISQYEMAFRMQTSVPELTDLSQEPEHVLELYGPEVKTPGTFANCCIPCTSDDGARCPSGASLPPGLGSTRGAAQKHPQPSPRYRSALGWTYHRLKTAWDAR